MDKVGFYLLVAVGVEIALAIYSVASGSKVWDFVTMGFAIVLIALLLCGVGQLPGEKGSDHE